MVQIVSVEKRNHAFKEQKHTNLVCVFLGATHGIGESTCDVVASMLHAPTFYIIGRSLNRFTAQRERLKIINPACKVEFVQTEASLISGIDDAAKRIAAAESKVDYLCMSAGYLPLNGPIETEEGLETCFALSYWSRMRLLNNLLPLLQRSSQPRVLSVLNGGRERPLYEKDLALANSWNILRLIGNSTTMTTLAFQHLAESNKDMTFIHSDPGQVPTKEGRRMSPVTHGKLWMIVVTMFRWLMSFIASFKGIPLKQSGQRNAFQLTSEEFRPGVWRVNPYCEACPMSELIEEYRQGGWPDRIWDFTVAVWDSALQVSGAKISQ